MNTTLMQKLIWDSADNYLRLIVPAENYGDYILPFTALRRIESKIEPKKQKMVEIYEDVISDPNYTDFKVEFQMKSNLQMDYWNTSPLSLNVLAAEADQQTLAENFKLYLNSFSANVDKIWKAFKFEHLIEFLNENGYLWHMVNHFSNIDMSDEALGDTNMGDVFEGLMNKSFSRKGTDAGEFYTPKDTVRLMTALATCINDPHLEDGVKGVSRSVYDPAAGTCGLLIEMEKELKAINENISVRLAAQELKDSSFALGSTDLLMNGIEDVGNILQKGNTLTDDAFGGQRFNFVLANPPYGSKWSSYQSKVNELRDSGDIRYSHGLPYTNDAQMLFLSHIVHKLTLPGERGRGGRAVVVSDGSPLFTGGAETGPDELRKFLIGLDDEYQDILDSIVVVPGDTFFNTSIDTYLWVFDMEKEDHRKGFVQLIDARPFCTPVKKSIGNKRIEFTESNIADIVDVYRRFEESDVSLIVTPEEFLYKDVPVFRQARYRIVVNDKTVAEAVSHKSAPEGLEDVVWALEGVSYNDARKRLKDEAKAHGVKLTATVEKHVLKSVSVFDEDVELSVDAKGNPFADPDSVVIERVPFLEDVEEHMLSEVAPFAPDMVWDVDAAKVGSEIPLTRLFYREEPEPSLKELDDLIQSKLEWVLDKFKEVRSHE